MNIECNIEKIDYYLAYMQGFVRTFIESVWHSSFFVHFT